MNINQLKKTKMRLSQHFLSTEFASPDIKASGLNMHKDFIRKIQKAREIAEIPFKINSGYRTVAHNLKIGGKQNSAHLRGYAADIAVNSNAERYIILNALLTAEFTRIGIYANFIHCDCDPSLPQHVIWTK